MSGIAVLCEVHELLTAFSPSTFLPPTHPCTVSPPETQLPQLPPPWLLSPTWTTAVSSSLGLVYSPNKNLRDSIEI